MESIVREFWMPIAALLFAAIVICANMLMAEHVECPQCGEDDSEVVSEWGGGPCNMSEGRRCNRCSFGWTRHL